MTDEATGMSALMIPELQTNSDLVAVKVRPSARDHLRAWDAAQRLVAIHESGHLCALAAQGLKARAVDITGRHGGWTAGHVEGLLTLLRLSVLRQHGILTEKCACTVPSSQSRLPIDFRRLPADSPASQSR